MTVVVHQAGGMAEPVVPLDDMREGVQDGDAVLVALEDRLPRVAAGGDMMHGAGVCDPQGTGHGATMAWKKTDCNEKDLTLEVVDSLGGFQTLFLPRLL